MHGACPPASITQCGLTTGKSVHGEPQSKARKSIYFECFEVSYWFSCRRSVWSPQTVCLDFEKALSVSVSICIITVVLQTTIDRRCRNVPAPEPLQIGVSAFTAALQNRLWAVTL